MLKIPFRSLFYCREKNSSYEGWYADIDTAAILEINRLGRVTGVLSCSQLHVQNAQYLPRYRERKFDRHPDVCRRYQGFPDRRPHQLEGWHKVFEVSVEKASAEWALASANGNLEGIWLYTMGLLLLFIAINLEQGRATETPFFLIIALGVVLVIWNRLSKSLYTPASPIKIWVQSAMLIALIGGWVAWWNL